MAKQVINFRQLTTEDGIASAVVSFVLPKSCIEVAENAEYSDNKKLLPMYENDKLIFEVTLEDGTVTTFGGKLTMWSDRTQTKSWIKDLDKIREQQKREKERAEKAMVLDALKASLTPEQLQAFENLGMFKDVK